MYDLDPTLSLPKLLVITAFAVPIGVYEAVHWQHWQTAQQWPLENGTVVRREQYKSWTWGSTGRLHIRIAKDQANVAANVSLRRL